MKKMTLGWRLGASFGALILLMGGLGGVAVWRINLVAMNAKDVSAKLGPEVKVSNAVNTAAWEAKMNMRCYSLTGNEESLRAGRRGLLLLKGLLKEASVLAVKYPELVALSKGVADASGKTEDLEGLVDKMESEYKNLAVHDAGIEDASKRFVQASRLLRSIQQKRMSDGFGEKEGVNKAEEAAVVKVRVDAVGLVSELIDMGNMLRINLSKAGREGDMDGMRGVLEEFAALETAIAGLAPLIRPQDQESAAQVTIMRESADEFKKAVEKGLKSRLAIRELSNGVLDAAHSVTSKYAEVTKGGMDAIGAATNEVTSGLEFTGAMLLIGVFSALLLGVLISWLCTRAITAPIREGMKALAATASEISTTISHLASGAAQTAAAVAETTTTVDEVRQTAQVAADKAKAVADSAQGSVLAAEKGRKATDLTVQGLNIISDQMSSIGESITRLNEQSQAVGDIVATVADLAEQSNLLAVNASIEAAKAGEHGKGFAVVAQEIRNLAEQSKDSTKQVRAILNDVQKATGHAVLAAEQGRRGVVDGSKQADEAGLSIRALTATVQEATRAAVQIAASSQQQLIGVEQVGRAMESIKTATSQNAEGARQLAMAALSLREIGARLKAMVESGSDGEFPASGK